VAYEAVELHERAGVEQQVEALPREELAALVLPRNGLLRGGVRRLVGQLPQPRELRGGRLVPARHRAEPNHRGSEPTRASRCVGCERETARR
jgi:hypothetical protein